MAFNSNSPRQEFTATASQVDFDFNFKIFADTDIVAYLTPTGQTPNDATDLLTITTDYTVTVDGDDGGTLSLVSAALAGDKVTITRNLPVIRTIEFQQGGDILADTTNDDQEYQTYLVQQNEANQARFITLPVAAQGLSTALPAPISDSYFKWSSDGLSIENDTTIPANVQLAKDWANEDEDIIVADGEYSSKHYSLKSSASASEAAISEANAEAAWDSFDDRYLGPKAVDPTVDNDGDALLLGALYFNTTTNEMKVYASTGWEVAYASLSGTLLATNNLSDLNDITIARTNLGVSNTPLNISSMLEGTISLSNTIQSIGFKTQLYTGNGTSQDIVTGVNMKDNWADYSSLALWSAGTYNTDDEVYILDSSSRKLRVVCLQDGVTSDPNTLLDFTDATFSDWKIESKTFGGRVWIKNRDTTDSHQIIDTIREATNRIESDNTSIETVISNGLTSFSNNGFSVGSDVEYNTVSENYTSWTDQTTFCESGLTNQNKPYIRETNVVTGYFQIKRKGSGQANHIIETGMDRDASILHTKQTSGLNNWISNVNILGTYGNLDSTGAINQTGANLCEFTDNAIVFDAGIASNANGETYIDYGYCNSYIDENNILQGNYEIGTYVGTGASGNKITTKAKPAYVIIKRTDSTGDWIINDNIRGSNSVLFPNNTNIESVVWNFNFLEDGIILNNADPTVNASGGQYLYLVVYDNDSGSGSSKYDQATDTTQLQINNAILSTSSGYDSTSGVDNKISIFDGTVLPTNGWEE